MSLPRYERYKDSGVEWLGEVPDGWEVKPVKAVSTCNDDVLEDSTPADYEIEYVEISGVNADRGITETTTIPFGAAPSRARRRVKDGDVIVSTVRTYLRAIAPVIQPAENMIVSTGFAVVRPRSVQSSFLGYLFRSEFMISGVIARSVGVSYPAINASELIRLKVPFPPLPEQQSIATFLDRETGKIDELVAEQERLIALLKEKRQAVISHAVTKGLNPDAPMKDSGIKWLGKVPEHWEIVQSRRYFSERKDRATTDDKQLTASQKHGILYQEDFMVLEDQKVVQVIIGADILKHVEPNDFVISMRSFQGGIEWSGLRGSISSAYVMLVPSSEIYPSFYKYLLKSASYIQALQSTSNLVRDGQALRYNNFTQVALPLSTLSEQSTIAAFLDSETVKIDALVSEAQQVIGLLKERRSALISAAVTGKIDVRFI